MRIFLATVVLCHLSGFLLGRVVFYDSTPSVNDIANRDGWQVIDPTGRQLAEMATDGSYWVRQ